MQDVFTPAELKQLMEDGAGPRVSLYMPTHRSGAGYRENQLKLKNLIKTAEDGLEKQGVENPRALTEKARGLIEDTAFWEGRSNGLALFLSEDTFVYYRLPMAFDELAVVSGRFHIKPLVGFLADSRQFFILGLSQSDVKLYQATRYSLREMDLGDDIPTSLEESMRFDEAEPHLQYHTGTSDVSAAGGDKRRAMFHGQGVGTDRPSDRVREFFLKVSRGLNKILPDQNSPLVLAGLDPLCATYREVNSYPKLLDDRVAGNYKELSEQELAERAWEIAEPHFRVGRRAAAEKFGNLMGTGLASSEVEEIVPAAFQGRVDSLFVPVGKQVWGDFDQAVGEAHMHEDRKPGDFDLLDYAAGQAMANGAAVYAVEPEKIPNESFMAAVFRY